MALSSLTESGSTEVPSEEVILACFFATELQPHSVGKVIIIAVIKVHSYETQTLVKHRPQSPRRAFSGLLVEPRSYLL